MANVLDVILSGGQAPLPSIQSGATAAQALFSAQQMGDQVRYQRALSEALPGAITPAGDVDFDMLSKAAARSGNMEGFMALQQAKVMRDERSAVAQEAARRSLPHAIRAARAAPEAKAYLARILHGAGIPISEDQMDSAMLGRLEEAFAPGVQLINGEQLGDRPGSVYMRDPETGEYKPLVKSDVMSDPAFAQQAALRQLGADRISISNQRVEEPEFYKEMGKLRAQSIAKTLDEAEAKRATARESIRMLNRAESLLEQARTGAGAETVTRIKALAKDLLGADLADFGVTDDVSPTQAYHAFANRIALQLTEYLPGQISNRDLEFLKESSPGLWASKEANRILIGAERRRAQVDLKVANRTREMLETKRNAGEIPELSAADRRELDGLATDTYFTDKEYETLSTLNRKASSRGGMEIVRPAQRPASTTQERYDWNDLVRKRGG